MIIALIFIFIYLSMFGVLIASYILQSLAFHTLARRRGISNPWLAWLPFGNYWIIGSIARDYDKKNGINRRWDRTSLILSIVYAAIYFATYIGTIIGTIIATMSLDPATMSEETSIAILLVVVLMLFPMIIIAIVLQAVIYVCIYKIYESTVPEKALKYFIIGMLVPFAQPICLFLCRNKGYEHPDQMAYIYNPVNRDYSYIKPVEADETVETTEPLPEQSQEDTE